MRQKKNRVLSMGQGELLNCGNQRYLAIIYDLIKPECVWKLIKWVDNISEEHKKVRERFFDMV